jgi:hypothetical protein
VAADVQRHDAALAREAHFDGAQRLLLDGEGVEVDGGTAGLLAVPVPIG